MPTTELKTPIILTMRTTANHLFCCVNQCSILVFDNAKSSLVRCTFSYLTTHSTTSLNGIGFARVYSFYTTCKSFTVRITGFSDKNTSETVNWSFGSFRSFSSISAVSICIWHQFFLFLVLCSKIVQNCYIHSIIHMQIHIFILTGKNIFMKVIWSCIY